MTTVESCSRCPAWNGVRWPTWLEHAPQIVAESLTAVRDPLAEWLLHQAPAPPATVAAGLARALLPSVACEEPPAWLRTDQRLSFGRALAAARRYGGALLADGVGTGKTYIGIAVAAALSPGRPVHVLAPASLVGQWKSAGERTGVRLLIHSHETLSRGRAPGSEHGAVIVDESHRFRTSTTRRYDVAARWGAGRKGILLSATPAVNQLSDVATQLLLLVRDDALAGYGLSSLRKSLEGAVPGALASLVITGEDRSEHLPAPITRDVRPEEPSGSRFEALQNGIDSLRLSRQELVARLIKVTLLQALASSPAALAEALARYRTLLQHAGDAAASGSPVSRRVIRRMIGLDGDQLVLWPLLGEAAPHPELSLEDLGRVMHLEEVARDWRHGPDLKLSALRQETSDRAPTLVFTTMRATVHHLRAGLAPGPVAWCTGGGAGTGHSPLPREVVLDWFRVRSLRSDGLLPRPRVLIATDVAAEGLDLPLVERVVHYDLPWTAVRLTQRSGRALRLGSLSRSVQIIRFLPGQRLEAMLRKEAVLDRKAMLPVHLGLGAEPASPWRLRARIAAEWAGVEAGPGIAAVRGSRAGVVAGFRIRTADSRPCDVVLARSTAGWTDDPGLVGELLNSARGGAGLCPPAPAQLRIALRGLAGVARSALKTFNGAGLGPVNRPPLIRRAVRRLMALARVAAHQRNTARLRHLDRGLGFLRRGHTAGESRQAESWAALPDAALMEALSIRPPEDSGRSVAEVVLIGVLIVEPDPDGG